MVKIFTLLSSLIVFSSLTNASPLSCLEQLKRVLPAKQLPILLRLDGHARLDITPVFYDKFISYIRNTDQGSEVVVRRLEDGQIQFKKAVETDDVVEILFNRKKGTLNLKKTNLKLKRIWGYSIKPIEREPVSYNEVLKAMELRPYDVRELPTIPLQMFRFFANRLLEFFVGNRSVEILKDGRDYRKVGMDKPIHPMGIGVEGKIVFKKTKYSGVFAGGEFPMLGRLSISQGNPSKYKERTWFQRMTGAPADREKRSVAAAFKVFNTQDKDEKVVTANALFQNDLNGEVLENYIDGVMTNQPQIDFLKIRQAYEVFTLMGVVRGALANPNDLKKTFPFINPQLRPLHQFAEMGVDDPLAVVTPTWIKLQSEDGQEIIVRDDFREELLETIQNKGLRYDIFLADEVDEQGEIIWERAGHMEFEKTILSQGVDQNVLFHHDGLRSPFTGEIVDPDVVPVPVRSQ
jgi:hypothetical protein